MEVGRRAFIQMITAAVAGGAVLDVDKLLWVPKPMIVVPALPVALVEDATFTHFAGFGTGWFDYMNRQLMAATGVPEHLMTPELGREMSRGLLSPDDIRRLAAK